MLCLMLCSNLLRCFTYFNKWNFFLWFCPAMMFERGKQSHFVPIIIIGCTVNKSFLYWTHVITSLNNWLRYATIAWAFYWCTTGYVIYVFDWWHVDISAGFFVHHSHWIFLLLFGTLILLLCKCISLTSSETKLKKLL